MLRRNFITAAIGSLSALFTGKFAKAGPAGSLGTPIKSFADLDWSGSKGVSGGSIGTHVPDGATVYSRIIKDGDCTLVSRYIVPSGQEADPRRRAAILHAKASPAMNVVVLDVNGTLVRISTLGIAGMHSYGVDAVNPSDSVKIVSNSHEPCVEPQRVTYRLLEEKFSN